MPRKLEKTVLDEQHIAVEVAPGKYHALEDSRNATIAKLAAEPRVPIHVPLPAGMTATEAAKMERPPALVVGINGFNYLIKRGFTVNVPESVARQIRKSGQGG